MLNKLSIMAANNHDTDLSIVNFFTGLGDGLILPFIVGVLSYMLGQSLAAAILFLLMALLICGTAYGVARYYAEIEEIRHHNPVLSDAEDRRELDMMAYVGIEPEVVEEISKSIGIEKKTWTQEIEENNLQWEQISKKRARKGGWETFMGFVVGGVIGGFIFGISAWLIPTFSLAFLVTACLSVLVLVGFVGGWKARFTGRRFSQGAAYSLAYGLFSLLMPTVIAYLFLT